jgi:hypothetical protein
MNYYGSKDCFLFPMGSFNAIQNSTTKTGRHDIAEILLKVELKHQKSIKIKSSLKID